MYQLVVSKFITLRVHMKNNKITETEKHSEKVNARRGKERERLDFAKHLMRFQPNKLKRTKQYTNAINSYYMAVKPLMLIIERPSQLCIRQQTLLRLLLLSLCTKYFLSLCHFTSNGDEN